MTLRSTFGVTGTHNDSKQVSLNDWNNLLTEIDALPLSGRTDVYEVTDYGIVEGDASGANGVANSAALATLIATIQANAANATTNYQGCGVIRFPLGRFEFAETIDLTDGTFIIEGLDTGFPSARGTILKFPAGVTGIRVQRYNTSGAEDEDSPTHRGGDGSIIRNLALWGGYAESLVEDEAHGIQLRARATIDSVFIQYFEGDGIYGYATAGGTPEGNANNAVIWGGRIQNCRNGIYINGADSNIWALVGVDVSSNRQWGVWDSGFLGNSFFGLHAAACGITSNGTPSACVSDGTYRYGVIAGQEAGASTNAPSGTTADNTWWYYIGVGGAHTNFPLWVSGTEYRAGGSYRTDNSNARSIFSGCYHESGQGKAQIIAPSMVVGGMLASSVYGTGAVIKSGSTGALFSQAGFSYTNADATKGYTFGASTEATSDYIMQLSHSTAAPSVYRFKFNGLDMQLDYQNSNSLRPFLISGPSTTQQLGKGEAAAHFFISEKFAIGSSLSNARQMTNGTAAPVSGAHGPGEIVWNRTPSSGNPMGWICTVAGTPGTWAALANVA